MKKILGVFAFAVLLMAIDNFANAQNQSVTTVGNPDSNNLLIIEEGYQAVTVPVNAQPQNSVQPNTENNNMTTEGNVQVAPAPADAATAPANSMPAQPQPSASQPNVDMPSAVVDELTEVDTPDSTAVEASETIYQ